jgi:SNF2 family DNA or RNA helicase
MYGYHFELNPYHNSVYIHKTDSVVHDATDLQKLISIVQYESVYKSAKPINTQTSYVIYFDSKTEYNILQLKFGLVQQVVDGDWVPKAKILKYGEALSENYAIAPEIITYSSLTTKDGLAAFGKKKFGSYRIAQHSNDTFMYLSKNEKGEINLYALNLFLQNWHHLAAQPFIYLTTALSKSNGLNRITLSPHPFELKLHITELLEYTNIELQITYKNEDNEMVVTHVENSLYGFVLIDNVLYRPTNLNDVLILENFSAGSKKIPNKFKTEFESAVLEPLVLNYPATFNNKPVEVNETNLPLTKRLMLTEHAKRKSLLFTPAFMYGPHESTNSTKDGIIKFFNEGQIYTIKRDFEQEQIALAALQNMHPALIFNDEGQYEIPIKLCLQDAWFVKAIQELQNTNWDIIGQQQLQQLKVSKHLPTLKMRTSSGIDWFEIKVDIEFGDEIASLKEVRAAIVNGSYAVRLKNGSLGLLPKEWLNRYATLLRIGDVSDEQTLKISKLHFTLIDELHDDINEEEVLKELEAKKQKLLNIEKIKVKNISNKITATLRPYQEAGVQWLQTLDEVGWGACLADDMGLGKTLQTIAFLQYVKEKYKKSTSLIVCPTSLIYNWEAELNKFAPSLKYLIHYGLDRNDDTTEFVKYDLIITSYGNLRSDIENFKALAFKYVVLDESQAIKNPIAQVTKCVQLLKADNKIILSGTPIQNNTFDLYAQFNFINPGLLGNADFFRTEFANAIDKHQDKDASALLKKMVAPFILRRTKEQVATDLPEKVESVIYCELGGKQRKVYETYKNYYRDKILERIDAVGMAKAGFIVLEGMLRLRQICDSPELVKNEKVTTKESVKIDELIRELQENTGSQKVLVFSQFTEMLALVEEALIAEKISYTYLDGSTKAADRKKLVEEFQTSDKQKVFLISLKAGGVGLNLTAANYVYLIDPWWNPAAEQQAIDRTHRIGQKQNIFAYKMICKDTIEEKILQLQEKKLKIASDIIQEDAAFLKKLKRDDVAWLFS